jgi:hypothetical protein
MTETFKKIDEKVQGYGFAMVEDSKKVITLDHDDMPWLTPDQTTNVHLARAILQGGGEVFIGSAIREPGLVAEAKNIPNSDISDKQFYTGVIRVINNERVHTLPVDNTPHTIFYPTSADEQGTKGQTNKSVNTWFMRLAGEGNVFIRVATSSGKGNEKVRKQLKRGR